MPVLLPSLELDGECGGDWYGDCRTGPPSESREEEFEDDIVVVFGTFLFLMR